MAKDKYLSPKRASYLDRLKTHHKANSQPRVYHCPHHNETYYLRTPTLRDEDRWSDERKYPTPAKQIAARIAILLVDEDGNQILKESDVPTLMETAGFVRHALDMIVAVGDADPGDFSEEDLNDEKKESSPTPSIGSY